MGVTNESSLPAFKHVKLWSTDLAPRDKLVVHVRGASPARATQPSAEARRYFWTKAKCIQSGNLVMLVEKKGSPAQIRLATVTVGKSRSHHTLLVLKDTAPTEPQCRNFQPESHRWTIQFGISFLDEEEAMAVAGDLYRHDDPGDIRFILDTGMMYESVRPFMSALQAQMDAPNDVPMARYLKFGDLSEISLRRPQYSTSPGFRWDLSCLLSDDAVTSECLVKPTDERSLDAARKTLNSSSTLDER